MCRRVELADPLREGTSLQEALQKEGFVIEPVALEEVGRRGPSVVVVATDAPGGEEAARSAAARRGVHVVLIGQPVEGLRAPLLARPVTPGSLVQILRSLLHEGEATVATDAAVLTTAPVERTLRLGEGTQSPWHTAAGQPSDEPSAPSSGRPPHDRLLAELFRRADRRLFPEEPPMELRLPANDEGPEALVPDEILLAPRLDEEIPAPPDPEGLTFVAPLPTGTHKGPPPSRSAPRPLPPLSERPTSPNEPATSPSHRPPASRAPRSTERLEGHEALARLWALCEREESATLEVSFFEAPGASPRTIRMGFLDGTLRTLHGPLASRVLRLAQRAGLLDAMDKLDEDEAAQKLQHAERQGVFPPGWLPRARREQREAWLHALGAADSIRLLLRVRPPAEFGPIPPVQGNLPEHLVEGARRRISAAEMVRRLGHDPERTALVPTAAFETVARLGRVPPEWMEALLSHGRAPLSTLLDRAGPSEGLPGLLWALYVARALRVEEAETASEPSTPSPEAVRSAIRRWRTRARRCPHHEVLGVSLDASPRQVIQAAEACRLELEALAGSRIHGAPWKDWLREALEAVEEAEAVLSNPELSEAYRRALRP